MASGYQKLKHHVLLLKNKLEKLDRELIREQAELAPDADKMVKIKDAQKRIQLQINMLEHRIDHAVNVKEPPPIAS